MNDIFSKEVSLSTEKFEIGELLGVGATAGVYTLKNSNEKAIKLFHNKIRKEKIFEEYNKMKYLLEVGIKVPKVFEMIKIDDQYGFIMERVKGQTLSKIVKENYSRIEKALEIFAKILAKVNKCNDEQRLLKTQKEYYENLIIKLTDKDKKKKLLKILRELPEDIKICHTDTHLNNVMCDIDKNDMGMMVDWIGTTRGNPLGNFAFALVYIECTPIPEGQDRETEKAINKFIKVYTKNIDYSIDRQEFDKWRLIAAAALFVGNKEFREEVKDDLLKERIDNKLKKFDGLIEELLSKQD